MRKLLTILGLLAVTAEVSITVSCGPEIKREMTMLDSLDLMLKATSKNIEIDVATIVARRDEIERNLNLIKRFYNDTISEELGNNMQKYKGVMKIYKHFLNNNGTVTQEVFELGKQVKMLRNSVKADKLTKTEFRKYYDQERSDIVKNLELSERIGKIVFEIEPEYQRLNRLATDILNELSTKNEELREILK